MPRMLESDEAARRLGIKVTTLYAYVSRGLLVSHPAGSGRKSLFDMDEVERLARRARRGRVVESRMATITTGVTQLTEDGPIFRGRRATDLAREWAYEDVADWLWAVDGAADRTDTAATTQPGAGPGPAPDRTAAGAGRPWAPLALGRPPDVGSSDRMRWAVVMAGALDPVRADLRPESVVRTAPRVAASMVEVLPLPGDVASSGPPLEVGAALAGSMAERLTRKLSPAPTPDLVRGVNAALVLMADHELASSTLAVRVAASTRADVYDALLAGLATLAGPLHGGASQLAYGLLVDARRHGVDQALGDTLRWQRVLPGFGHTVYKQGDPRFAVLLGLFEELAAPAEVELVRSLIDLAAAHAIPLPNVDLAIAAIAWSTGMAPDAGRTIFTVARVAGWVAHYLEELGERPLRYRARAVYASSGRS